LSEEQKGDVSSGLRSLLAPYRVVLVGTMYAGNVGSVARLCTNYALTDVHLAMPECAWREGEALLYAREHSRTVLEGFTEHASIPDALAGTHYSVGFSRRRGDLRNPNIELDEIAGLAREGRVSLVFGGEESGLSTEEILHCSHVCSLPTADIMPSLNLSHAVAVVVARLFQMAYETGREQGTLEAAKHFAPGDQRLYKTLSPTLDRLLSPVPHDTFESLVGHWRKVMVDAGLTQEGNPDRMLADIRRILQRASMTERDANILHGVLSAVERTLTRKHVGNS